MAQGSLSSDLLKDIGQVESKLVGLAKAIPADKYTWRPGEGVRSVSELFMHISADNYLIPAAAGTPAPAATGVKGDDYNTAVAFEKRQLDRDATIRELEASFKHLKGALASADANMGKTVKMFGQDFTTQQVWILATTHLHEHLGQAIAYARTNGVVPPWSR
jgi:uncharacterized damage-inducible protein DinB